MPLNGLQGVPTKIGPAYLPKTLSRLLPPASVIKSLSLSQMHALVEKKREWTHLITRDPARFWIPNPGGQQEFADCRDAGVRVMLYLAGNKAGKTTVGALRHIERRLGRPIWGAPTRSFSTKVPSKGVVFAEDFDSHKEVTLPTILSWMPEGCFKAWTRNPAGHITDITWQNGSQTIFRTYEQGSDKIEGKDWDDAWCDEPPPRDSYTAIFRGLVVNDGLLFITATLLKEGWLFDEAEEHDYVRAFEGSIHDNKWLPEQAKLDFLAALSDEERQVRETGRPMSLTGLVYKNFQAKAPFVIEDQEFNEHYPIIMGVDPHERKPLFVEYAFVEPSNRIVWFKYLNIGGSEKEIFDTLALAERHFPHKPVVCYMDPNRGSARQKDGESWSDAFERHGYSVQLGNDDLRKGHTAVRNYLDGPDPLMVWTESCLGKGGPVHAMTRYAWIDANKRRDSDPLEKPKERYKDWPDIHRYVAIAQPDFSMLTEGYSEENPFAKRWQERRVRAYG